MTALTSQSAVASLREHVRGPVLTLADDGYQDARRVYNAMHDRQPAAVVRAADVADVMATVRAAADAGLDLAVRGGSHSVPGFGTCDDGLVLDLGGLTGIRVDPRQRIAHVEGGCTWGDVNHATHAFGLATTGGIISTTGVAGLTLGGGIGYLARAHGLTCDNVLSADVVTATGELVRASAEEHPDLFWALRGGGGNFGVVTSLELALHPVGQIHGGPMLFELDHAAELLATYRDWIREAPRAMSAFPAFQIAPPLPFIPEAHHGRTFVLLVSCFNGSAEDGEKLLAPFRDVATPVAEHVGVMPYPALNSAFDALLPPGLRHYWKASFVNELSNAAIGAHLAHGPRVPSVQSTMHLYPINGAVHDVAADDTAFAYRDATFAQVVVGAWPEPADDEANVAWVRDYHDATAAHAEAGGYVNFMADDDGDRVAVNYAGNHERLVAVKRAYDPHNVFRLNQNIAP